MPTNMHVCSPYCGRCKPPKESLMTCPNCQNVIDPEIEYNDGICAKCGAQLPPRQVWEPIFCLKIKEWCARPCGMGKIEPKFYVKTCVHHTPLTDSNTE